MGCFERAVHKITPLRGFKLGGSLQPPYLLEVLGQEVVFRQDAGDAAVADVVVYEEKKLIFFLKNVEYNPNPGTGFF